MWSLVWRMAVVAILSPALWGQTAQVGGSVQDSSQSVVAGAVVTAAHVETGVKRSTVSNESGYYTIPLLPPGSYRVTVETAGFRTITRSGIRLEIGQVARLDFALEVGEVTQTVEVQASTLLLQTADTSQGQVIANKQILDLPLNGRNYTQLILLSNGATQPEPGTRGQLSGFSSNGQRSYQNNFLLDGIDNNTNLLAIQSNDFEVIQPNLDALQEFKVQTNAYSAEYGRGAGAVVNVAIKSGTNQPHGTLFEFLRNDNIEANNFFNNRSAILRPEFRQNQFGGTFGGPLRRDRAFFFGDYQGTRIRRASTQSSLLPTPAERQGDFSQTRVGGRLQEIFDPMTYNAASNTRQPFAGNRIPAGRLEPAARTLIDLYPAPNVAGAGSNYLSNFPIENDTDQFDARSDLQFGTGDRLFARASYQDQRLLNPAPLPAPAVGGIFNQGPRNHTGHSGVLGHTHIFGPRLLSELRLGFTRTVANWATTNREPLNPKFGIRGAPPDLPGLAEFTITGYATLGDPGFLPNLTRANNYEISESLRWNRGRHDVSFGGNLRHVQSTLFTTPQTRGSFAFAGNFTRQTSPLGGGNGAADFLLGIPTTATISGTSQAFYLRNPFAFYAQDSWHRSSRLTLNAGLRYERAPWYHERYGSIANLFPPVGGSSVPRLLTPGAPGALGDRLVGVDNVNFAPRVGLAWQARARTVIRAGYGVFFGAEEQIGGGPMLQNNPPFNVASAFTTNNITPNILLGSGFPPGATRGNLQTPNLNTAAEIFPSPYAQQWNLTLEQQVKENLLFSLAYVGTSGVHLYQTFQINAPPPGPGNINDRRPIRTVEAPTFGPIRVGAISRIEPRGLSNYHSLQAKAERRFSGGLFFLASWIYSKAIDYSGQPLGDGLSGGINNHSDLAAERGRAPFDVRHRMVFSYGYELPFGKGKPLLSQLPSALDLLAGGWQIQGITTWRGGFPFTVAATGNASNTQSGDRPDLVSSPRLGSSERSIERWFDTAAFRRQAQFAFGNAGRNLLSGPGLANFDVSAFKNFLFRERSTLQFRAEVFNLSNTANFGNPGAALGTAAFGLIRSTVAPPRQYQFAVKLLF